jgi:hypothetical protein
MSIVTAQQVKEHLQMDHDLDDSKIAEIAQDASELMLNFLKKPFDHWQDTAGEPAGVPGAVKAATLKLATALYENRDGSGTPALSQDVKDMVHRYRDPALA